MVPERAFPDSRVSSSQVELRLSPERIRRRFCPKQPQETQKCGFRPESPSNRSTTGPGASEAVAVFSALHAIPEGPGHSNLAAPGFERGEGLGGSPSPAIVCEHRGLESLRWGPTTCSQTRPAAAGTDVHVIPSRSAADLRAHRMAAVPSRWGSMVIADLSVVRVTGATTA